MPEEFALIKQFPGYITKEDKTQVVRGALVAGSQNVLIVKNKKVKLREGYSLYGAVNTDLYPIESAFIWKTNRGDTRHLRSYNDTLEFYDANTSAWVELKGSFTAVDFSFATWWYDTEKIDLLLFVNGTDNFYDWSGATAVLSSATANTITKTGTKTFAEEGFLTAGTRKVVINGTEYTYTGGESGTTLTGVSPDPSGEAASSTIFQAVRTNATKPVANFKADFIKVIQNQLWVGSYSSRLIYVSKNSDFTNFAYSSPRVAGEGALLTLDDVGRGVLPFQGYVLISAGNDFWYKHSWKSLEVNATLCEISEIQPLKSQPNQAAQSQDFICGDYFLSFEPALRFIRGIDTEGNLITNNISDLIQPDFKAETFTNGQIFFHQNRLYVLSPTNGNVYIYQIDEDANGNKTAYWQPPQKLPLRRLTADINTLYGYSSVVPETYTMFDTSLRDAFVEATNAGNSFKAVAKFAYDNGNDKNNLKQADEIYIEGYIRNNTSIIAMINFDYQGSSQIIEKEIDGSNSDILFYAETSSGLGDEVLGDDPLGDSDENLNPKFRTILEFPCQDHYEYQLSLETDKVDLQWEILTFGANLRYSVNKPTSLKQ